MQQILHNFQSGETYLQDVPCPSPRDTELIIQTHASLISAGTERMLVDFGKASYLEKARQQPEKVKQVLDKVKTDGLVTTAQAVRSKLNDPIPLGYSNVGTVIALGSRVDGFAVGDRVVSNGHHAEVVAVPQTLASKIPETVTDEAASFAVVGAIALQGVRLIQPTLGETVVIFGLGLIGQLAVQLVRLSGCRAIGFDVNEERVKLARSFGADAFLVDTDTKPESIVTQLTDGIGADAALITASTKSDLLIHQAASSCRKRGRVVLTGVTGLNLQRAVFYEKELTFQVSCSYGPGRYDANYEQNGADYPLPFVRWTAQRNFDAVIELLRDRRLSIESLITRSFDFTDAESAYDLVSQGDAIGVILDYPRKDNAEALQSKIATHRHQAALSAQTGSASVGLIGAGGFTRAVIAPALAKTSARLKWVASKGGLSASTLATTFSFEQSTTETSALLDDPDTNTVFITTRHDSHFHFIMEALARRKNIFVEKPLCLNEEELEAISARYYEHPVHLMVGFNRRFAPAVTSIRECIKNRTEPLSLVYLCNAGSIPENHWLLDPAIGGGRLIGEGCHFIDLLVDVVGHEVESISAVEHSGTTEKKDRSFTVTLGFADGSIGTLHYFVDGSKKYPKEQLTLFSEGRVLEMNNFRTVSGTGFSQFKKKRFLSQDKGHQAEIRSFIAAIEQGLPPAMSFESIARSMRVTFEAQQALQS